MYTRLLSNAPCWCGSGKKYKKCHEAFDEKIIAYEKAGGVVPARKLIKTAEDVEKIKGTKKTMAEREISRCMTYMRELGYSMEEIQNLIANYKA